MPDTMNAWGFAAAFAQSVSSLAWPGAVVGCVWILRDDIRKLLPAIYLKHGETEIGVRQIVDQVQVHEAQKVAELAPSRPLSTSTEDLSLLSDDRLRIEVEDCALKMRELEQTFRSSRSHRDFSGMNWAEETQKLLEESDRQRREWQTTLQPVAVALRDELLRRVPNSGDTSTDHDKINTAATFELGMLAGVSPLGEAALYLEKLARDLGRNQ